jgi:hypothetical protein
MAQAQQTSTCFKYKTECRPGPGNREDFFDETDRQTDRRTDASIKNDDMMQARFFSLLGRYSQFSEFQGDKK